MVPGPPFGLLAVSFAVRSRGSDFERNPWSDVVFGLRIVANTCTIYHMSSVVDLADEMVLTPTEFAAAMREHEQQAAALALSLRRLETSGEWAADGAVSIGAWLRDHCRMTSRLASTWIKQARFLDRFPAVADAALCGVLSAGQTDLLRRAAPPKLRHLLDEQQAAMVDNLAARDIAATDLYCKLWKQRAEAEVAETEPPTEPERALQLARADDGPWLLRGILPDATGVELQQAINTATTWEGESDTRTRTERSVDAFHDIIAFYNRNHTKNSTARNRPHVDLSIDASTLQGYLEMVNGNGHLLEHFTAQTMLCDCILHQVMRDNEHLPTGYGRARYTAPAHLFRQLAARDGGCRYPGCYRPVNYTETHHIFYWYNGGPTDADNLLLLCSRHHHHVHRHKIQVKLLPNGHVHFTWPDGTHRETQPRGAPPKRTGP